MITFCDKKLFSLLFTAIAVIVAPMTGWALEVSVEAVPSEVIQNGTFRIAITTDTRDPISLLEVPAVDGVSLLRNRTMQSTSIINGKIQQTAAFTFLAQKTGTLTIPYLTVKIGDQTVKTDAVTISVVSPELIKIPKGTVKNSDGSAVNNDEQKLTLENAIFAKASIPGDRTVFYVGEEIPLEIYLYSYRDLRFQASYPRLQIDKAIFHDYSGENPDSAEFTIPSTAETTVNGLPYQIARFKTSFRVISPGTVKMSGVLDTAIIVPRRRSNDPFADFFSNDTSVPHPLELQLPELTIKSLPTAPSDANYIGLIGDWEIIYPEIHSELKVGEPFSLQCKIRGDGSVDGLKAPELSLPSFRVYPPEIRKSSEGNGATIEYIFIPLSAGKNRIDFALSTFQPAENTYRQFPFSAEFEVQPGAAEEAVASRVLHSAQYSDAMRQTEEAKQPELKRDTILYLKSSPGSEVALPLWKNHIVGTLFFLIAGPLLLAVAELVRYRRMAIAGDEELKRKKSAQKRKGSVLSKIRSCSDDELDNVVNLEVLPLVNDLLSLPPGTSATEAAENLRDSHPELAVLLNEYGNSSYLPGAVEKRPAAEGRKQLLKILKRLGCVALFVGAFLPTVCSADTKAEIFADGVTQYDAGRYQESAERFSELLNPRNPSPNLLYNIGCARCQAGEYPLALQALEEARLLDPSDSAIQENLNFVRRKLMLEEIGQQRTPTEIILAVRNILRPDQWFYLTSILVFGIFVILTCRRLLPVRVLILLLGIVCLLALLAFSAGIGERKSNYSERQAVVLAVNAPLRSLPADTAGDVLRTLPAGTLVQLLENRTDFCRIRVDNQDGWIAGKDIGRILPDGW